MVNDEREINNENDSQEDSTLLLVSGKKIGYEQNKSYIKSLSNAIMKVYGKYQSVNLRCVGKDSVYNAVRAFLIAQDRLAEQEEVIAIEDVYLKEISFDPNEQGETIASKAIVFHIEEKAILIEEDEDVDTSENED